MSTGVWVAAVAAMVVTYVAAGMLVAARVAERSGVDAVGFRLVVVLLWPVVAVGIQLLWLLGINDWHLR